MIEIELDADVSPLRLGDDVGGVLDPVEEVARPVARIDRLDQQRDVLLGREIGRLHEIADEDGLAGGPLLRRELARQHMDLPPADRDHIVERLPEQDREFSLAARHAGEPELTGLHIAGRRVEAEHGQAVLFELRLHRARGVVVGKLQLDRGEARGRRGREALHERSLGEQVGEIGGKAGHVGPGWAGGGLF